MSLIDRIGGAAGIGAPIYVLFLPGCVLPMDRRKSSDG